MSLYELNIEYLYKEVILKKGNRICNIDIKNPITKIYTNSDQLFILYFRFGSQSFIKELNIENHNFNLIVEPINLREIRSADGSVTDLIKKKKHSVKKEKKLILMQLESKLKTGRLIEVIAHEMVHVKQTVRGQLASRGVSLFWRGKKVLCSKINYYDRPWEIEAWSKQTLLSNKIFRLLDKQYEKHVLKNTKGKKK